MLGSLPSSEQSGKLVVDPLVSSSVVGGDRREVEDLGEGELRERERGERKGRRRVEEKKRVSGRGLAVKQGEREH